MEENKPPVLDNYELEYQENAKNWPYLEFSDLQWYDANKKAFAVQLNPLCKCEAFNWDFDGRNQTSSFFEVWVWITR